LDRPEKLANVAVTRIGAGVYRIEHQGRTEIVYVAGSAADRWIFWSGHVFHEVAVREAGYGNASRAHDLNRSSAQHADRAPVGVTSLVAPMPAKVGKIFVKAGEPVRKGDAVIILEAMKMEMPLRAPADATIKAVRCHEGELVQADSILVELI
jgi:biotin carboxyl carrier protein